jgi:hypothetical protein
MVNVAGLEIDPVWGISVDFSIVPGGTSPLHTDPAHPRVSNQESARTGKQPNNFANVCERVPI